MARGVRIALEHGYEADARDADVAGVPLLNRLTAPPHPQETETRMTQQPPPAVPHVPGRPMSSRSVFSVVSNNPVPLDDPAAAGLPADAEMGATLRAAGAGPRDLPLARIYASRAAEPWSLRTVTSFWIRDGVSGGPLCSVHRDAPDTFDVQGADGAALARITYRGGRLLPWPRRARWSVRFGGTDGELVGPVGTWYAWLGHVVSFPVWLCATLFSVVYALFDGTTSDVSYKRPTRTRWRAPGVGTVLDYRGVKKVYRLDARHLDLRVAYPLATLQTWSRT